MTRPLSRWTFECGKSRPFKETFFKKKILKERIDRKTLKKNKITMCGGPDQESIRIVKTKDLETKKKRKNERPSKKILSRDRKDIYKSKDGSGQN